MNTNLPYKFTIDQLTSPKARHILFFVVTFLAVLGATIFIIAFLDSAGNPSRDSSDKKAQTDEAKWLEKEMNRLKLCGLSEIVDRAEDIEKSLTQFDVEAKRFHKRFGELYTSTNAGPLLKYQGILDYFGQEWKWRLPEVATPQRYRIKLGFLLMTIREAMEANKGYIPHQVTLDQIENIGNKSQEGFLRYRAHNQLLDALSRKLGEGPQAPPGTIQSAVLAVEDETVMGKAIRKPWKEDPDVPFDPPDQKAFPFLKTPSAAPEGIEELYRQENKARQSESEGKETLMRDTVPDDQ